jgi:hypothetical protein
MGVRLSPEIKRSVSFRAAMYIAGCWFKVLQSIGFYSVDISDESIGNLLAASLQNTRGILCVTPHSDHNMEVLLIACVLYSITGNPVRGVGHWMMRLMLPHYESFGMEVATPETVKFLLEHREMVCVMPGGAEEMLGLYLKDLNSGGYHWRSLSGRPRYGFARLVCESGSLVLPCQLLGVENMCWSPLATAIEWLGARRLLAWLLSQVNTAGRNPITQSALCGLVYVVMLVMVMCKSILVIPTPSRMTFVVHTPKRSHSGSDSDGSDIAARLAMETHSTLYSTQRSSALSL